jgi:hypothetical protein
MVYLPLDSLYHGPVILAIASKISQTSTSAIAIPSVLCQEQGHKAVEDAQERFGVSGVSTGYRVGTLILKKTFATSMGISIESTG